MVVLHCITVSGVRITAKIPLGCRYGEFSKVLTFILESEKVMRTIWVFVAPMGTHVASSNGEIIYRIAHALGIGAHEVMTREVEVKDEVSLFGRIQGQYLP